MILVIHGRDRYRSRQQLLRIKERAQEKQAIVEEFDFSDYTIGGEPVNSLLLQLKSSIGGSSLFNDKRCIIIKEISQVIKIESKRTQEIIKNTYDHPERIIIWYEHSNLPKTSFLLKYAAQWHAKIEEYELLSESKQRVYMQKLISQHKLDLSSHQVTALLQYTKGDWYFVEIILNYIELSLMGAEAKNVDEILSTVLEDGEMSIFGLSDTFFGQRYVDYQLLLNRLDQYHQEGIGLWGYLSSQISKAYIIKSSDEKKNSELNSLKINPFVIRKLRSQLTKWSTPQLKDILHFVAQTDYRIKYQGYNPYQALRSLGDLYLLG